MQKLKKNSITTTPNVDISGTAKVESSMPNHLMSRRRFLAKTSLAAASFSLLPGIAGASRGYAKEEATGTLFYKASKVGDMWDPMVLHHDDMYYMFHMVGASDLGWSHSGICLATSSDAVHWKEHGPVADARNKFRVHAGRVWRAKDRFMMNHGSIVQVDGTRRQCIRFWESEDLLNWKYRGDEKLCLPDARWYGQRWDCMDVIPKVEGRVDKGFWGYITGDTREDWPYMSVGMLESKDGVEWEVIPPPVIEWGDLPQQLMELGSCGYILGKYYMILGARYNYLGNAGYSMFTFISDKPRGPFRPAKDAFRLSGASHRNSSWLSSFCHAPEGILVNNYLSRTIPGPNVYFIPFKKPVIDNSGNLRLGYWQGNEAAKGERLDLNMKGYSRVFPFESTPETRLDVSGETLRLQAKWEKFRRDLGGPVAIALDDQRFDFTRGIIMEGNIRLTDTMAGTSIKTHIPPVAGGFFIEEKPGKGTGVIFESYGITRIERMDFEEGVFSSEVLDVTGPGCATVAGVHNNRKYSFRLIIKLDMIEIYLDNLLVQSFHLPQTNTGRTGFYVQSGTIEVEGLKIWQIS